MGKIMICEGCGEPMKCGLYPTCHPDSLVHIYMIGSRDVPGKLFVECGTCHKQVGEFTVTEFVDLEQNPKVEKKRPKCSGHS